MRKVKRVLGGGSRFSAILAADLHLRDDAPECRELEEYQASQWTKMDFIRKLCEPNGCPLFVAGDLFDYWKPSPGLITRTLHALPELTIAVAGQHDLRNHEISSLPETGLGTLAAAGRVIPLSPYGKGLLGEYKPIYISPEGLRVRGLSFGEGPEDLKAGEKGDILLWHRLILNGRSPIPKGEQAEKVCRMKQLGGFDLVVTGDNHQQFEMRNLLNPGSMMRMTTAQKEHRPAVYGWRPGERPVPLYLPMDRDVILLQEKKETKEERDFRMEAYVRKAETGYESRLSFSRNLRAYMEKEKTRKGVQKKVWQSLGNDGE